MSCLRTVQSEKSGRTGCIKLKLGETVTCPGTQSRQVAKAILLRWAPRGARVGWDLRPGEVGPWEPSPRTQESRLWAQRAPCLTLWAPACFVLLGSSALRGPGSLPPGPGPGPPGRQCPSRDSDSELYGNSELSPSLTPSWPPLQVPALSAFPTSAYLPHNSPQPGSCRVTEAVPARGIRSRVAFTGRLWA